MAADCRHTWLAIVARANARHVARLANHLLRKREAFVRRSCRHHRAESARGLETKLFACALCQAATNDEWDAATGAHFVEQHVGFEFEFCDELFGPVARDFTCINIDVDDVAGVEIINVAFEWQGACVFHRVEENRGDFAADADAAIALVRNIRDVVADKPQHRVGR